MKKKTLAWTRVTLIALALFGFGNVIAHYYHANGDIEYYFVTLYLLFIGVAAASKIKIIEQRLLK